MSKRALEAGKNVPILFSVTQTTDIDATKRAQQLDDLARLRAFGMGMAEDISRLTSKVTAEETREAVECCGVLSLAFSRVARSVRQVVALEEEAMGLREMRKTRERRNADTALSLRRRVGGLVRERVPGIDKDYLEGLLGDLFRDYDDYDDLPTGDIAPILATIRRQLDQDRSCEREAWPALPKSDNPFSMTFEELEQDDAEFQRRITEELDKIAANKAAYEASRERHGHDPP